MKLRVGFLFPRVVEFCDRCHARIKNHDAGCPNED